MNVDGDIEEDIEQTLYFCYVGNFNFVLMTFNEGKFSRDMK